MFVLVFRRREIECLRAFMQKLSRLITSSTPELAG